eukprot:TRINITY_DN3909_c0_g1_i1.p1 TRINITY_DN3909_c0_g1~~TRINITY_DN3909_c0_g1_i1.p1  ORF type:complete len:103 (-),score=24.75 TRINITY_DN3909_c0_g1_i1:99-407(-)
MVQTVTGLSTFKSSIAEGVVVVDFFAEWCGPCKAIAPKVAEFEKQYKDVKFYKVDVDESGDIAQQYNITCMPTFLVFKGGNQVSELKGANPKGLEDLIKAQL